VNFIVFGLGVGSTEIIFMFVTPFNYLSVVISSYHKAKTNPISKLSSQ